MKNQNKRLLLLLGLVCVLSVLLVACAGNESDKKEEKQETMQKESTKPLENQFDAVILSVEEDYVMVEVLEGQNITGEVRVNTGLLETEQLSSLEKDDVVRITHDGKMTMSIPPQMTAVEVCEL